MKRLAAALWGRRYDVMVLLGVAACVVGIAAVYWPAAVITGGLAAVILGAVGARTEAAERRRTRFSA